MLLMYETYLKCSIYFLDIWKLTWILMFQKQDFTIQEVTSSVVYVQSAFELSCKLEISFSVVFMRCYALQVLIRVKKEELNWLVEFGL